MKKTLLALAALLVLGSLASTPALADPRGNLTISATFGNLAVYSPPVHYYPPQQVIVVKEPRYEKKVRHGKRHQHRDRHECYAHEDSRRPRYQESTVVYYYPPQSDYRNSRGYRYE